MLQIRHESRDLHPQTIDRSRSGDIERPVVFVSPSQIRRLLRNHNRADMMALGVPHPNSLGSGDEKISLPVDFDSVGHTIVVCARLFAKNAPILQNTIGSNVVDPDIALLAVVDIKMSSIGRKSQAVRLRQVFCQQANTALVVQPIDPLEGNLLLFSLGQIKRGVGKVDCAVRADDDIVWTIELLSLVMVRQHGMLALGRDANDCPQDTGTVEQLAVAIEGVTVGIAKGNQFFFPSIGEDTEDLVDFLIAHIKKSCCVPNRSLGKTKAGRNQIKLCILAHKLPKFRRLGLKLELARRLALAEALESKRKQQYGIEPT